MASCQAAAAQPAGEAKAGHMIEDDKTSSTKDCGRLATPMAFALMLESACEDFEFLRALIEKEISIEVRRDPPVQRSRSAQLLRARARIPMALAKSFLFFSVRAYRICEHGAGSLHLPREERKLFLAMMRHVVPVRDVNEHGFEPNADSETTHFHKLEDAMVDETSLTIIGSDKILMGPLNVCDVYRAVDRMRKLAGFAALRDGKSGGPR